MAKLRGLRFSLTGWLFAAVIAPAMAGGLASIFVFFVETLPLILRLQAATPEERSLFGFQSLQASLAENLLALVRTVFLGPMLSVPLGFVGACAFLAPAFLLAELRPRRMLFMVAGGTAGALHAISGAILAPLESTPVWISVALGYFPYAFGPTGVWAFGCGAVVAGLVAGYAYARIRPYKDPRARL